MSEASPIQVEVEALCSALVEGYISDQQRQRLEELVCADPVAKRTYVEYLNLHATLYRYNSATTPPVAAPGLAAGEDQLLWPGLVSDVLRAAGEFLSRSFVLTLLLAVGLPAIVLVVLVIDLARQPVARAPEPAAPAAVAKIAVAKITDLLDCVWADRDGKRPAGTKLFAGEQLELKQGLAEVAFVGGAKVILRGPATFRIGGASGGRLGEGSLAATVPPGARGFTVDTPHAKVVDLGTEFGVVVAADGRAEAHVFVGQVEVAAAAGTSQAAPTTKRLRAGEAVEIRVPEAGKTPELVAMAAEVERFVRRLPEQLKEALPEPTILFAHRGKTNPAREGWRLRSSERKRLREAGIEVGPVDENDQPAWSIRTVKDNQIVYYSIEKVNRLTPKLVAEAEEKGWVLRARVWMSEKNQIPPDKWKGLASVSYRDGGRAWTLRPTVDRDGNQVLLIRQNSSLGVDAFVAIADSRNQYVDYEVRYNPATRDADVFVNGRRVATGFSNPPPQGPTQPQIRFGGWRPAIDVRFASVEWGILRDSPKATDPNVGQDQAANVVQPPAGPSRESDQKAETAEK